MYRMTRSQLHALVWSEPMRTLSQRFGISDVALAKTCKRHSIPVPERGYWARLKAGQRVRPQPLPDRGPGMFDEVVVAAGQTRFYRHDTPTDQEILQGTPSPPEFERSLDDVTTAVKAAVGRVTVPKTLDNPHRLIAKLLADDEDRRQKVAASRFPMSWDQPKFDSPFERRRLRFLNAVFMALERCGMKPSVRGQEARELSVQVNDVHVSFSVDDAAVKPQDYREYQRPKNLSGKMKAIISPHGSAAAWEDTKGNAIEKSAAEIVIALIVAGERQYRAHAEHRYRWMVERKAALIEEARRRREEAARKERERLVRLEKARVDRLLGDAAAFKQAQDIRAYVEQVDAYTGAGRSAADDQAFRVWANWARSQADRIDPVLSARYLDSMRDREEAPE